MNIHRMVYKISTLFSSFNFENFTKKRKQKSAARRRLILLNGLSIFIDFGLLQIVNLVLGLS